MPSPDSMSKSRKRFLLLVIWNWSSDRITLRIQCHSFSIIERKDEQPINVAGHDRVDYWHSMTDVRIESQQTKCVSIASEKFFKFPFGWVVLIEIKWQRSNRIELNDRARKKKTEHEQDVKYFRLSFLSNTVNSWHSRQFVIGNSSKSLTDASEWEKIAKSVWPAHNA